MIENLIHLLQEKFIYNAIFIMYNVELNKVADIKELITNIDYEIMCPPPYLFFLNPVENMFSEHK